MKITVLIGNGFDLNLGLKTKYSDFIDYYLKAPNDDECIKKFKKDICNDCDTWADAEVAFGKYTSNFGDGCAEEFCKCHEDFCEQLATYLKNEETKLNFSRIEKLVYSSFYNAIKSIIEKSGKISNSAFNTGENIHIQFINFNYTSTLTNCINIFTKNSGNNVSVIKYGDKNLRVIFSSVNVHGTTEENLVLGVDNENQLEKMGVFKGSPNEYLNQIIKRKTNERNGNFDQLGELYLQNNDLIYVFGMSLGETDCIWWERVINFLTLSGNSLVIQRIDVPNATLVTTKLEMYRNQQKNNFLCFSKTDPKIKAQIAKKIFIDEKNIFKGMENIVDSLENRNPLPIIIQ